MTRGHHRTVLLALLTAPFLFLTMNCSGQQAVQTMSGQTADKPAILGGPCRYQSFSGWATIVSITPLSGARAQGPPYRGYEVKFMFKPDQPIPQSFAQPEGSLFPLRLTNSWPPGSKFIQKYGIVIGKTFPCVLKIITQGTCTPMVFDFPTIDLSDYSESS